ncbi:hypothetical protein, partial [Rhodoferax ferrireducens]|uniref:hypothetical protein n=1 Tax=Rhodoferax ferrireducens TaxID=192843 RepID=UPI003BB79E10
FSPTHSPNPGFWGQSPNSPSRRLAQRERRHAPQRNWCLTPITQRGELHLAACLKVGNLVHHGTLASKWPQHIDGLCKSISTPRQRALKCLQQIEKPLNQFDGNVPMRTFFPPSNTRPNVAVSSLSAPAGVERVGVRGGIQRKKIKNAADNPFGNSNNDAPCVQKVLQKQERTTLVGRGLEAKKLQDMLAIAQLVAASRELTR